jgi:hypothetical protein
MSAALLVVALLAPAVYLQHWRRPKPARIPYERTSRARGRHAR